MPKNRLLLAKNAAAESPQRKKGSRVRRPAWRAMDIRGPDIIANTSMGFLVIVIVYYIPKPY